MTTKSNNQIERSPQETKQLVIQVAQKLFMTHGYRSVSTRQIAEVCGVTQPALYYHFQNKKMIYIDVVRSIMERTKSNLILIKENHSSFRERLYGICYYMLMNHGEDLSQMFHDLEHEMDGNTQILIRKWWMDSYLNPVVLMVEEAVKEGQLRDLTRIKSNTMEIAFFVLELMKSFIQTSTNHKLTPSEKELESKRKSELMVTIFLEGISG